MFYITKEASFAAAHRLPWHKGVCSRLHGHTYRVKVTLGREKLDKNRIVFDLQVLGGMLQDVISAFDHQNLNDIIDNPTCEELAIRIKREINALLESKIGAEEYKQLFISSVLVSESSGSEVVYIPKKSEELNESE